HDERRGTVRLLPAIRMALRDAGGGVAMDDADLAAQQPADAARRSSRVRAEGPREPGTRAGRRDRVLARGLGADSWIVLRLGTAYARGETIFSRVRSSMRALKPVVNRSGPGFREAAFTLICCRSFSRELEPGSGAGRALAPEPRRRR